MKLDRRTARLLSRFEKAAVNLSWIGTNEPDSHDGIRSEYHRAKELLIAHLVELQPKHSMIPRAVEDML